VQAFARKEFSLRRSEWVNQQQQEQIDEATSTGPKAQWTRPELCRLDAGAAEFGDVSNPDAQPGFS
jgi:hypothetical protein